MGHIGIDKNNGSGTLSEGFSVKRVPIGAGGSIPDLQIIMPMGAADPAVTPGLDDYRKKSEQRDVFG